MTTASIMQRADQVLAATYKRFPIVIEKGSGCTLWDTDGRSYTDFIAGIAVCNLGHAHPQIARAISAQAQTLVHVSNLYYTLPQVEAAERLIRHSFADRVFFCNSGAEANEAAIKLARKYFHTHNRPERHRIISMEQSFHGRTMAALSATGQEKIRHGYDPILTGFEYVPFNDIESLQEKMDDSVCAVMVEPIQGEGGVCCPDSGYLKALRNLCDRSGALLIYDEIQTGMGRTGTLFAYEHDGVEPDIMTLAKALANGLPMGAMLARESVAAAFGPGSHASTFGGTPLVTAACVAVLEQLIDAKVVEYARQMGDYFQQRLQWLKSRHTMIAEVRGRGLLLGLRLEADAQAVVASCMKAGYLINCVQEKILRFAPPLIIERQHIDELIDYLDRLFSEMNPVRG
jgi:acetylornithine aminotransferase